MNGVFPAAANDAARCRIQACRVEQVSRRLNDADCPAIVLFDPVNIRYATGKRNMQVGAMHNICRYAVLFASGEAEAFCHSLQTCEQSVAAMRERLQPGMGETDALAQLIDGGILSNLITFEACNEYRFYRSRQCRCEARRQPVT